MILAGKVSRSLLFDSLFVRFFYASISSNLRSRSIVNSKLNPYDRRIV
jgi:hypothetical protein